MNDPSWQHELRLARARAVARGVEIQWERLGVPDGERQATITAADQLAAPPEAENEAPAGV